MLNYILSKLVRKLSKRSWYFSVQVGVDKILDSIISFDNIENNNPSIHQIKQHTHPVSHSSNHEGTLIELYPYYSASLFHLSPTSFSLVRDKTILHSSLHGQIVPNILLLHCICN